jgi:hypothetical protein
MRDLTQSLENASMSSPAKDSANSSINPQSHNNAKGRK